VSERTPEELGLGFEPVGLRTRDGLRLAAWHLPHPRERGTVALFHGYASCKAHLLPEAAALHAAGWGILLVDFRGAGESEGDAVTLGAREAEDVRAAAEWARTARGGRPVVLYGVSMGAAAVLRAVARLGVEPDAVILERPFNRMRRTVGRRFQSMGLPAFPAADLLVFWGGVQHGFNGFAHNPETDIRALRCPALVLYGGRDPRATPADVRALADAAAAPVTRRAFPDAGHESLLARDAERFHASVYPWLDAVAAGSGP
jgi:alpha-beta hydrolase superfamily lysophospholipase